MGLARWPGRIADELVQIRGGRGFETADSLAARGERAVPAEQMLRDLRINRIFEGSSEIMRLLIAREAVDAHLTAAGDLDRPRRSRAGQGEGRRQGERLLRQVAAAAGRRQGRPSRRRTTSSARSAKHLRYVERRRRKLARADVLRHGRWQAKLEYQQGFLGRDRRHRRRAVRDGGGVRRGRRCCAPTTPEQGEAAYRARRHVRRAGPSPHRATPRRALAQHGCRRRAPCRTGCSTATTPGSSRASSTAAEGTGPWISEEVPADASENVARRVIRPMGESPS